MSHAAPVWLTMAVCVAAAVALWFAIFNPRRRLSLWSLFVLVAMVAVALAISRWPRREPLEILPESKAVAE